MKMNRKQKHSVNPSGLSLLFFFFFFSLSLSDPRTTESALFCTTTSTAATSRTTVNSPSPSPSSATSFIPTFVRVMQTLSQLISTNHFATYSIPNSSLPMYGLTQCFHDLSQTDCLLCYAAARIRLPRCLLSASAALFLDGCFLRYDTYSFYNESVSDSLHKVNCGTDNVTETEGIGFVRNVGYAVGNVTSVAVENNGFGVVSVERVYALAQCWESVGIDGCRVCLKKAGEAAKGCAPGREGRGMNAGCYLRYSTGKFYNDGRQAGLHNRGTNWFLLLLLLLLAIELVQKNRGDGKYFGDSAVVCLI